MKEPRGTIRSSRLRIREGGGGGGEKGHSDEGTEVNMDREREGLAMYRDAMK